MEERKQTLLLGSDAEGIAQAARLLREGELWESPPRPFMAWRRML